MYLLSDKEKNGNKKKESKQNKKSIKKAKIPIESESDRTISDLDSTDDLSDRDNEPLQKLRKLSNTKEHLCYVCNQKLSTSKEDWFQCKLCQKWANEKCGDKGSSIFCNLCH